MGCFGRLNLSCPSTGFEGEILQLNEKNECKKNKQDLPTDCRTTEHSSCFSVHIKGKANVTWVHYSLVVFADLVLASEA